MGSVPKSKDGGHFWKHIVESKLIEFKDEGKVDYIEDVAKDVHTPENPFFKIQDSLANDICLEGDLSKEAQRVNCKMFRFNSKQINILNQEFLNDPYPSSNQRQFIARQFKVSEKSIMNWFVNRRYKLRKNSEFSHEHFKHHAVNPISLSMKFSIRSSMKKCGNFENPNYSFKFIRSQSLMQNSSFRPWRPWITSDRDRIIYS